MSSSSFRPIAPATHMDAYAASCNPPRRAKRLRADSNPQQPQPDLSSVSSLSSPPQLDDDVYDQLLSPAPKRRGRKPGTMSRAAREAQRKINHSLIEKARRTKINDALATLRELVPSEYKRPAETMVEDSDDEDELKKSKGKSKNSGEKEFKLEILVRTVAYLQDLTQKVKELEDKGCPHCTEPISFTGERGNPKKARCESIPDLRSHATPSEDPLTSRCSSVAPTSRLPSISAWLPSSAEEHQSLLLTPSQSPTFDPTASTRSRSAMQLPTPPTSANCAPSTSGYAIPPVLTLPSPSTFLPPMGKHMQPRFSGFTPRASTKTSPLASPVYTPEDETAASLLLRISSSTSPQTSFKKSIPPRLAEAEDRHDIKSGMGSGYALTPSRLLGLTSAER